MKPFKFKKLNGGPCFIFSNCLTLVSNKYKITKKYIQYILDIKLQIYKYFFYFHIHIRVKGASTIFHFCCGSLLTLMTLSILTAWLLESATGWMADLPSPASLQSWIGCGGFIIDLRETGEEQLYVTARGFG